ncbi:MAG: cysteine desulfurase [Gloeomargaritaceae cyanobacterium C42_A2020_066]|nr:cysteine desulfurase [Gloeomargaritaceae cyanobacterium C42_A2020_066]
MQIYLDHSATTPPHPQVVEAMARTLRDQWGNPASTHAWGERAALVLETARTQVAELVGAEPDAVIFTSGGTEANNLAILGVTAGFDRPQHLITSQVEHPSVSGPIQQLARQGWRVTWLPVDAAGRVDPADLARALRPDTVLVSIVYGQSEVGTVQPIETLGALARERGVLFHTDAVQAAGRTPLDLARLPVDLLSLSAHKLYGPQGCGALVVGPRATLQPHLWGGGQERGLRSGTPPLPAIAGFGEAARVAMETGWAESARLVQLRERLLAQLIATTDLIPTGHRQQRLCHHLSFVWPAGDGQQWSGKTLVRQLNLAGIGISSGSACASGKTQPSPVLLAMGFSDREARCGIRLTLGRTTTAADVDWVALALTQILERLTAGRLVGVGR